jgi:2-methylcitrate dehydratase PrpD
MAVTAEPDVTAQLAAFAVDLRWTTLPATTRAAARRTFANVAGLAVGASRHDAVEVALAALHDLGLGGSSSVLGRRERMATVWAPLVSGIAMHVEDFDDTHLRTVIHPGAPVVSAALTAAECAGASGADLLTAVVAGVEVACRVGNGISPGHFDRGWHLTGTMGHLGAAAAAGHLLGLTAEEMVAALAIAATQAAGVTEQLGTMAKPLHPGKAASDGLEAALLASRGFTGPTLPVEGRRGLAALMAPRVDVEEMLAGLGRVWEIESNAFKPYSCGIVSHPVIDAAIALRGQIADAGDIESVEVVVRPVVLEVMGVEEPSDGLSSKFSVYHCFAVGFLDGAAGPAQYSDDRARAEDVVALRRRVHATVDADMPKDACQVLVRLVDGRTLRHDVEHAVGSISRPMTDEQLRAKFDLVVAPVLGPRTDQLWQAAFGVDDLPDLRPLFELAVPST